MICNICNDTGIEENIINELPCNHCKIGDEISLYLDDNNINLLDIKKRIKEGYKLEIFKEIVEQTTLDKNTIDNFLNHLEELV